MDELTGIFDNLTPEDFFTWTTSAISESPIQPREFADFVEANIATLRTSFVAADGMINPVATLATSTRQWIFTPTDDESLGDYIGRLHEEARNLNATWLFISRKTLVGSRKIDNPEDLQDVTNAEEALAAGLLQEGLLFYAERSDGGQRSHTHGIIKIVDDNKLGERVDGSPDQTLGLLSSILD